MFEVEKSQDLNLKNSCVKTFFAKIYMYILIAVQCALMCFKSEVMLYSLQGKQGELSQLMFVRGTIFIHILHDKYM